MKSVHFYSLTWNYIWVTITKMILLELHIHKVFYLSSDNFKQALLLMLVTLTTSAGWPKQWYNISHFVAKIRQILLFHGCFWIISSSSLHLHSVMILQNPDFEIHMVWVWVVLLVYEVHNFTRKMPRYKLRNVLSVHSNSQQGDILILDQVCLPIFIVII